MRQHHHDRQPRFISMRWNEKYGRWEIRIGTPEIIAKSEHYDWAMVWARQYSKAYKLPVRVIVPETSNYEEVENEGIPSAPVKSGDDNSAVASGTRRFHGS